MLPENSCQTGSILFDFHADDHIDPPFSHVWVWSLVGALVCCILLSLFHRAKSLRLARDADASVDPRAKLTPGARFIGGQVEYAEGQSSAITVHVEQHGTETKSKNGWSHRWAETNRTTYASPFYVRRSNGERVRIEPGANPLLVDKPDQMMWNQRTFRTRIAVLTPGEEVIVQGVLGKGHDPEYRQVSDYRGSGQSWVMTPASGKRMEVSTEKLGERHRKRARAFTHSIAWVLGILGFVCLVFNYYPFRLFGGVDTCAEIIRKDITLSVDSKGRRTSHYKVFVNVEVADDKQLFDRELDDSDWEQVEIGSVLAFRHVPSRPSTSELGTDASTHILTIIFAAFATLVGVGIYSGTHAYRRWYEGKLVDNGSGQLPEPPIG